MGVCVHKTCLDTFIMRRQEVGGSLMHTHTHTHVYTYTCTHVHIHLLLVPPMPLVYRDGGGAQCGNTSLYGLGEHTGCHSLYGLRPMA